LLEHCGGKFPLWLSPEQVIVLPISEKFKDYAENVSQLLNYHDIRSFVDNRDEKIGRKIRDAEVQKTPYMLIIGEKEVTDSVVSVRKHGEGDIGVMSPEGLLDYLKLEINRQIQPV
jgi:threonyl-tRNA synthetase